MPRRIGAQRLGETSGGFNFYQRLNSVVGQREYSLSKSIRSSPEHLLVTFGALNLVHGDDADFTVTGSTLTLRWDPEEVHPLVVYGVLA